MPLPFMRLSTRRSTRIYALDEVPEDVILRCVDAAQVAPNSSNLQCWELHRVSDATRKEQLVKACLSQPAAATAPELFVFVARPDVWKRNNQWMLQEFDRRGNMPEKAYQYFTKITRIAYTQGALLGQTVWFAFRACENPLPGAHRLERHEGLGAQKHGFVSGALHAGDARGRVRHMPDGRHGQRPGQTHPAAAAKSQICMVVSAGKRTEKGVYGDRFRFSRDTFYKEC